METNQLGRLRDILEAARLIGVYVKDTAESPFQADKQKQDAVIRRIEIIGEAAAHLTPATRQTIPEIPFRKRRGMRNICIEGATTVREVDSFKRESKKALEENVLRFVVCKVDPTTGQRQIERPNEDLWEHKYRFVRYLERTEGKKIFLGRG